MKRAWLRVTIAPSRAWAIAGASRSPSRKRPPWALAASSASIQPATAPGRLAHEPKAVAAELGHVRIDRGDGRRHRDHGLERIAAFGERCASRFDRGVVRRGDDAPAMPGGVKLHG